MPELPEVEAARCIICQHCRGRKIINVQATDDAKVFDGATAEDVMSAFRGRTIQATGRKGKMMWLNLDGSGPMPLMHFGMTGYVAVKDAADGKIHVVAYENAPQNVASNWPPRFHKLVLQLGPHPSSPASASCELAYCDARRFGRIKLVDGDPAASDAVSKLGFDPLLQMPGLDEFRGLLAARGKGAARLKPLLLDQTFCAGVGNWVADEVLWQARLHPEQLVSQLQPEHTVALHTALQQVVQTAVAANADSSKFPKDWMFHVRWGKKVGSLLGHKIDHITVGSRTSCYVPALQKLIGGSAAGAAKPKRPSKAKAGSKRKKKQENSSEDGSEEEQQEEAEESAGEEEVAAAAGPKPKGKSRPAAAASGDKMKQPKRARPQTKAAKQETEAASAPTTTAEVVDKDNEEDTVKEAAAGAPKRTSRSSKAGTVRTKPSNKGTN